MQANKTGLEKKNISLKTLKLYKLFKSTRTRKSAREAVGPKEEDTEEVFKEGQGILEKLNSVHSYSLQRNLGTILQQSCSL